MREGEDSGNATSSRTAPANESQSQHTPGPWVTGPLGSSRGVEAQAFDGSWKNICDKVRGGNPIEAKANAHLIAAAPDLLAALKLYEATYVTTQRHPTPGQEAICMNAVSTAIAKAEGQ